MKVKVALGVKFRGFSYQECFSMLAGVDCDGVELLLTPKYLFLKPDLLVVLSKQYNVPVISIHAPISFVPYAPQVIFARMLAIKDFFPNADTYVVHLSSLLNHFQNDTKKIEKISAIAREKGITLCFESNPKFSILKYYPKETYQPDAFGQFCMDHNLAITLDTSHISSAGGDIVEFYEKYHKNIKVIHLSDFKNGVEHLPLGYGLLPLEKLFKSIRNAKLAPKITLEIIRFPGITEKKVKEKIIKESIQYTKKLAQ